MTLLALIRKRDTGSIATAIPAIAAIPASVSTENDQRIARIAKVAVANPKEQQTAPLAIVSTGHTAPPPADVRIGKVIDRLHGDPGLRLAVEANIDADPDAVILTLAIRHKGACELRIPKEKYDPFLLLELIKRHSGTVQ